MMTILRALLSLWLSRELRRRYPGVEARVLGAERAARHRRTVPDCACVGGCGAVCALDAAIERAGG